MRFLRLLLFVPFAAISVSAQADKVWTGGGADSRWDYRASIFGTYTNWNPQQLPTTNDIVIFGLGFGSGQNINVNGTRSVAGITFNTTLGLTLSNGTIVLGTGSISRADVAGTEANHNIAANLALQGQGNWQINGSGALDVSGAISGTGFVKSGVGTLLFSGGNTNTYSGQTIVSQGSLRLNRAAGVAPAFGRSVPGSLIINGPGSVSVESSEQISDTAPVQVTNGQLNVNSVAETVGVLNLSGGQVTGAADAGSLGITATDPAIATAANTTNSIAKRLSLTQGGAGARQISVGANSSLNISGIIGDGSAGVGSITKIGPGTLSLSNTNSFTGGISVLTGVLQVGAANMACGTGAVVLEPGTSLTGSGTVNGELLVKTDARIAPWASGALTSAQNLVLGAGSYLDLSLGVPSGSAVVALGHLALQGVAKITVANSGGLGPGQVYTVLDATNAAEPLALGNFLLVSSAVPGGLRVTGKKLEFGTAPSAPSALTATPGSEKVDLAWVAPASPTLTGYNVYRGTGPGFAPGPSNRIATGISGTTLADTSASQTQPNYYKVTSLGFQGAEGAASNEASATAIGVPGNVYVKQFAAGANNGSSWADAFTSLASAVAAAIPGDKILVAAGTYKPGVDINSSFALKNEVAIYGGFPNSGDPGFAERNPVANPTILDGDLGGGQKVYSVVTANGVSSTATLDGFLIINGRAYGSPGNLTNLGGGIKIQNASPIISNCAFNANQALVGGGAGVMGGSPTFINCAFRNNSANYGGAIYVSATAQFVNCTIAYNSANQLGGGITSEDANSAATLVNSIIYANVAPANAQVNLSYGGTVNISYSDVQGGYAGPGNIDGDPKFVDAAAGDLRLQSTSVCGNAGSAGGVGVDSSDMDGDGDKLELIPLDGEMKPRIIGGAVEMGAFELTTWLPPPSKPQNLTATAAGLNQIALDWNSNTEADLASYNVYRGGVPDFQVNPGSLIATGVQTSDFSDSGLAAGVTYYYRVTAVDIDGGESLPSNLASAETVGNTTVWYVKAGAPDGGNGSSWSAAYNNLQSALAVAGAGNQIWVAAGIYKPGSARTDTFNITNGVKVYGGFPGLPGQEGNLSVRSWQNNITVLSGDIGTEGDAGDNTNNIVTANNTGPDTRLDGFTIRGGNANVGSYPAASVTGGGARIINGSINIRNCTLTNNNAGVGGAIFHSGGSPVIDNCVFLNNSSGGSGGGMSSFDSGSPAVLNCTFQGNSTSHGGGLYMSSPGSVVGCRFIGNKANLGGGLKVTNSGVQVKQCTFRGNSAEVVGGGWGSRNGGGLYVENSSPTITNCVMWGNSATGDGGGVCVANGSPWFVHCTIAGNSAFSGGGIGTYGYNGILRLRNTIVWTNHNQEWQYRDISWGNDWDVQYSITRLTYPGTGNISATNLNVSFVDFGSGDFRLNGDSVAVDKANPADFSPIDLLGLARPFDGDSSNGAQPDIGAYEYYPAVTTLLEARKAADNTPVSLSGVIVSRAFGDFFYIEDPSRAYGIRVVKAAHPAAAGQTVTVTGLVKTNDDQERYIEASSVIAAGNGSVQPLIMTNRAVGGGDWLYSAGTGAGQAGITGAAGLNNIGLFVTVAGKVTASGSGFFYVDDGSPVADGSGNAGLRVVTYGAQAPAVGSWARVSGISSCYKSGQSIRSVVRVSSPADIELLSP